jgi:hypothetical protein
MGRFTWSLDERVSAGPSREKNLPEYALSEDPSILLRKIKPFSIGRGVLAGVKAFG